MRPPAAATPTWSGLDARDSHVHEAPVPPPGALLQTVPLDPALSVTGAAGANRILYSTVDQHGRPAISTAVVFTPKTPAPEGG